MNSNRFFKLIGYTILILNIIIVLFGSKLVNNYNLPILAFFALIIILFLVSGLILFNTSDRMKAERAARIRIMHLIETGIKIEVPISQCTIKTNAYYEESESNFSSQDNLVRHLANEAIEVSNTSIEQSVLVYETQIDGKYARFHSEGLFYDKKQLQEFIKHNYKIAIYYIEKDPTDFFFDLQFYS